MVKRSGEEQRPLLLVVNDDGIGAPGIQALAEVASGIGEVVVVAPEQEQSGKSMALTGTVPVRFKAVPNARFGLQYTLSGTPVDCVKFGLYHLGERKPDLVLSGINHGINAASHAMHSGTVGAALTAAISGCRAVAFSHTLGNRSASLLPYLPYCEKIIRLALRDLKEGCTLNVNFPRVSPKGFKVCRQSKTQWESEFEQRQDASGRDYYWLAGSMLDLEPTAEDSELAVLRAGYISIAPLTVEWTDSKTLNDLKSWQ